MLCAMELLHALDREAVGADTFDLCTHTHQELGELLEVRLACCVVDRRRPFGKSCCHEDVRRTRDGGFIEEHVLPLKLLSLEDVALLVGVIDAACTELLEADEVCVQTATADLIAPRLGEDSVAKAPKQSPSHEDGSAQCSRATEELLTVQILDVDFVSLEGIATLVIEARHLHADVAQQVDEVVYIEDVGDVVDRHDLRGEEDSGDDLERFVLCALGTDATLQGIAAFNYVGCHVVVSGTGA